MERFISHPKAKERRDRNRAAGLCINYGPRGKVEHGPPVSDGGRCARCVEKWRLSK